MEVSPLARGRDVGFSPQSPIRFITKRHLLFPGFSGDFCHVRIG